jgi:DNA uptake protein ComE-like DNA-binding protein
MNLQPFNRRQDQPVRLGSHGYQLDGDFALLNAELHLPAYFSEQGFGLELWACPAPHVGGNPDGIKVAEIPLELPTPIGAYLHRVEARATLTPPLGEGEHSMVLMLVGSDGEARRVHDFANYSELQHFSNPRFDGAVGYGIEGDEVVISAQSIVNSRPEGNVSGSLSLELWASSEPYFSGTPRGHRLAGAELGNLFGQYHLPEVARRVAFTAPPQGHWHVALLLREWTVAQGYVTRDARAFDLKFEQTAALAAPSIPAVTPAEVAPAANGSASVASIRSTDKLRLIKPADAAGAADAPKAEVVQAKAPVEVPVAPSPAPRAPEAKASEAKVAPAAAAVVAPQAKAEVVEARPAAPEVKAPEAKAAPAAAAAAVVAPQAKAPLADEAKLASLEAKAPEAKAAPAAAAVVAPQAKAPLADEAKPASLEAKAPEAKAEEAKAPAAVEAKASAGELESAAKTPAAATVSGGKGLISVNTATVEELSRLPGLSLKVAKEILKGRPFASVDAVVDVRGVGEKTLRRIKSLLTL